MSKKGYAIVYDATEGKLLVIDGYGSTDITHLVSIESSDKNYKKKEVNMLLSIKAQLDTDD